MRNRVLIIFLLSIQLLLNGQTIVETNNVSTLPFEEINLVTDRDLYLSGESIWFKATVNLTDNQLAISNIIYIELFNADQKSLVRKKFRIDKGLAQGALDIPSEFLSDTYYLRAYTNYSKNFPPDTYFLSAIQIVNPQIGMSGYVDEDNLEPIVYFNSQLNPYQNNTQSSIAFTLPKKWISENYKTFLYADGKLKKECEQLKNGMGTIDFQAIDTVQYSLVFTNGKVNTFIKELDLNAKQTYFIERNKTNNGQQIVSIYGSKDIKINNSELYTLEFTNNKFQVLSSSKFLFSGQQTQIVLPESKVSTPGLYYLMLKNTEGKILKAQASILGDEAKPLPPISINKTTFSKRQLAIIQLNESNNINYSTTGIKAVLKGTVLPVIDKLTFYFNEPQLLFSYLSTSFNPTDLSIRERNIFLQILNSKLSLQKYTDLLYTPKSSKLKWIPEVRDIGLSGIVVNRLTQEPVKNVPVYLSIFREYPQIHIYESREDGSFFFSLNNFENEQDVFICPLFEEIDELELKVNSDFYPFFPHLEPIPLTIDSASADLLERMMIATQTSKVFNLSTKDKNLNISQLPYSFENPQISVVLDDYIETPTMEMVFRELIPSVRVRKHKNDFSLSIFDSERELFYNNPLILVDEIPIFNVNELMKISPEVVEKIEIHKTPFILGDHTINGIISVRTFTDNFGGMIMPASSTFFEYLTLSPRYVFKPKTYLSPEELNSRLADFRTVLYWNPKTDQKNKINLYTSDQTGTYELIYFGNYKTGQAFNFKLYFDVIY